MPQFRDKAQKPWSPQDEARLRRVRLLSRLLDEQFRLPGTTYRIGLDGLLGLIPGVGDAASALLSTYILYEAIRLGAPSTVLLRMIANIGIDTVGGAIPVVGDIFDMAWKANKKNAALLHAYLASQRTFMRDIPKTMNTANTRELMRQIPWSEARAAEPEVLLTREWLVTNGLGGYAAGTVSGIPTRRYHSFLVAALPAPFGRMMLLPQLSEQLRLPDGTIVRLGGEERAGGAPQLYGVPYFSEFRLECGLPIWRYLVGGAVLKKQVMLPYAQNTVHITYRLVSGAGTVRLKVMPSLHFRAHEAPVSTPLPTRFTLTAEEDRYEVTAGAELPSLRMMLYGQRTAFTVETRKIPNVLFRIAGLRGYEHTGDLWSPGYFRVDLSRRPHGHSGGVD